MWLFYDSKSAKIAARLRSVFLQPKRLAIFEAGLIGLVSGLAAVLLKQGVGWLGSWRLYASTTLSSWILLPMVGLVGGALAGLLVERIAPETGGSGIGQVKAALGGFSLALDLRVAIVKLLGTIVTVGSGLTLGRQGPTVQIGAALANQIGHWFPTSPDYRRQLIAAGAAAGLAAGFNAPIAGVLFAVEELLHDISGFTLGPAIIASFVGAVVSRILGGQSLDLNIGLSTFDTRFSAPEIPFYLILGILAGVFGTLFTRGIVAAAQFNRRTLSRLPMWLRVALAGWICGVTIAFLPALFRNNTGLREFLLGGEADLQASAIAFLTHFILTIVAAGSGAPGGLFAPSLILGSALGYLIGLWQMDLIGVGLPTTYALAGMGAFFCAVSKTPITAVVMIFEITTDFNLVLPLMIGAVVSYLVSETAWPGSLYDKLLKLKGIELPREGAGNNALSEVRAADVMQRRVETLSSKLALDEVVKAFARSHHRGFPVVDDGKLVGIVTQTDLVKIGKRNLPGFHPLTEIMTPQPVRVSPDDPLSEVLYQLNRYRLSRVPVTEGRKLVGIITRTDIIRAQSDRLTGENQLGSPLQPSYVVYQTRAPAIGRGRILVPLSNPQTAPALLRFAAAIAQQRHSELECLHAISVSRHRPPSETPVKTIAARRLLRRAERIGRNCDIPVHTQVRVAHNPAHAMLETVKKRHIDLLLMGWKGNSSTPDRIFGDIADTVIRQAACDVVLIKWGRTVTQKLQLLSSREMELKRREFNAAFPPVPHRHASGITSALPKSRGGSKQTGSPLIFNLLFRRWLVPLRGGPNAMAMVELLPDLVAIAGHPEVCLCQVFGPNHPPPDANVLDRACKLLDRKVNGNVSCLSICAASVVDALIDLVDNNHCDAIVLGASREGMLKQVMMGNIPEAIARNCDCTVILVRSAIGF
ncbi:chloride channel protein [Phormidium sp. CCY1219]|uniref:chloride channel protein n=1 Tax=Phormidium sp. CCY1219 TaxID=2886104 RepID=UPI002D1F1A4A|nr:chloride channel protein [Phormidium sp. CCY1219]MEB3827475.1 chloride channel protein [Phormidium sp. CCY1219]